MAPTIAVARLAVAQTETSQVPETVAISGLQFQFTRNDSSKTQDESHADERGESSLIMTADENHD